MSLLCDMGEILLMIVSIFIGVDRAQLQSHARFFISKPRGEQQQVHTVDLSKLEIEIKARLHIKTSTRPTVTHLTRLTSIGHSRTFSS